MTQHEGLSSDPLSLPPSETGAGLSCNAAPNKVWRCFHCDEVFMSEPRAREHFGVEIDAIPACKIAGHEGHLITYIRKLEGDLRGYREESDSITLAWFSKEAEHHAALRQAEEAGHARGVRDMQAQGLCADPDAHACTDD